MKNKEFNTSLKPDDMIFDKGADGIEKKHIPVYEYLINEGENLIYPELFEMWKKDVKDAVFVSCQDKFFISAIDLMKLLKSGIPIQSIIEKSLKGGTDFSFFCFIAENIAFIYSPRGPELLKYILPNWNKIERIKEKVNIIEERNRDFDELKKQKT